MSTLIVIAKAPIPGRVKTRLTPPFTPEEAAELARAALRDTLDAVLATRADHRLLVLDGEPDDAWLPRGFTVIPQVPGGLDRRLVAAFEDAAVADAGPVLLVGMDTPQVSARLLAASFPTWGEDAAFGPATDGGFWSLAFREPRAVRFDELILDVPMSHPETGRIQLERLASAGLTVRVLPELCDVDDAEGAVRVAALVPEGRFAHRHRALTAPTTQPQPQPLPHPQPIDPHAWTTSGPYARAVTEPGSPLVLETHDGERLVLDGGRFAAAPDAVDLSILDRCQGPTLDLGCGPGRLVAALAARGIPALGVDVAPAAVLLGRAAGAAVLQRSVFDRLPGAGRWPHALLMDGNIGIGGDPAALLDRMRTVLLPGLGELVVETDAEDVDNTYRVRFATGDADDVTTVDSRPGNTSGPEFGWARMGSRALIDVASTLGYATRAAWSVGGRRFVALVHAGERY